MAIKVTSFFVVLCMAAMAQAAENKQALEFRQLFSDISGTFSLNPIATVGALAVGVILFFVFFGLLGDKESKESYGYTAPASYSAPAPTYASEEQTYAALHSIDEASNAYQWNPQH